MAWPGIDLVLVHPGMQGLRHTDDLAGDRLDGRPLWRVLCMVPQPHAHRTLANFMEQLPGLLHGSIVQDRRLRETRGDSTLAMNV
jgi:hypothetical protein